MVFDVTVQLGGEDVPCGRLFTNVRRGVERASFTYDAGYLSHPQAFAVSPDLPLGQSTAHSAGRSLFLAFEDCMPDRWGRNLMLRAERGDARCGKRTARSLFEGDYLGGVSDIARQGALRLWVDGQPVAQSGGVPREVDLPHLLDQADLAAKDMDAEVRDLLDAGSSLGGARPKASVINGDGRLCIAKFPKSGEASLEDVCAWEYVALALAGRCGITVPRSRLLRVGGRAVVVLQRFDRGAGGNRVPYLSGMSVVQGSDGGDFSYLELVDFLEQEGGEATRDIRQLWLRILFSCAIGNTDDHMRNHGFLRSQRGWELSPAFDVNPTPGDGEKYLSSAIDFDERLALPVIALEACELFRMRRDEARTAAHAMARELGAWRRVAVSAGISQASCARMESSFESGIRRLADL